MSTPPRTTVAAVIKVLGNDYGLKVDGTAPDMDTYIEAASSVIDDVVPLAVDVGSTLSTAKLELLERWLAADFYCKSDPTFTSKSSGGASGSFVRPQEEPYREVAINLDPSGMLKALLKRQVARGVHIGEQVIDENGDWIWDTE